MSISFRKILRYPLGNFTAKSIDKAVAQYFEEFRINGVLQERALEECRFPLLLRFFCQAYEGRFIGSIRDIRLKALFDEYIQRKVQAISGDLCDLSPPNVMAILCDLAACLYDSPSHIITYSELAKKEGLCSSIAHNAQLYSRILDEDIIIETGSTTSRGAIISFVYDEFLEYLCARQFLDSTVSTAVSQDELRSRLVDLLHVNYDHLSFLHIAEYMMVISRENYSRPIWREMFKAGPEWHLPIVKALSKIPPEDLNRSELSLLLAISRYKGQRTSADARRMAKKSLSERYSYYTKNEQVRIWQEVWEQWGDEQQVAFISDNFELLDNTKWKLMLKVAENHLALGHEELMNCLDKIPLFGTNETIRRSEIIESLKKSVIPRVKRWAKTIKQ